MQVRNGVWWEWVAHCCYCCYLASGNDHWIGSINLTPKASQRGVCKFRVLIKN